MMSSKGAKHEATKEGRRALLPPEVATPAPEEADLASTLDATSLQSMMDSLKNYIFGKTDSLSTGLRTEILSVRQELKNSIEPLQRTVEAHEVSVQELERVTTDHSSHVEELEATVNTLTTQVKRLDDQCEDLESRCRRNNMRVLGVPEVVEGPQATDFITQVLQDLLRRSDKPPGTW